MSPVIRSGPVSTNWNSKGSRSVREGDTEKRKYRKRTSRPVERLVLFLFSRGLRFFAFFSVFFVFIFYIFQNCADITVQIFADSRHQGKVDAGDLVVAVIVQLSPLYFTVVTDFVLAFALFTD